MNDKQIVETFRKLKEYCDFDKDCSWCPFETKSMYNHTYCQIKKLAVSLATDIPSKWNMEEIERIINETD